MNPAKTKKALSIFLAVLLVINLVLFALGIYSTLFFWAVIAVSAALTFTFFRKKD